MSENEVIVTTEKKKKKRGAAALIIGGVALTAAVGGVFAYNGTISINGGSNIELGGGVADVSTCTTDADSAISQTFDGTNFVVDHVHVSGIDLTGCEGLVLQVEVGGTGATGVACDVYATGDNAIEGPVGTSDAFFTIPGPAGVNSFDAYPSASCLSDTVGKVIITTSN